MVSGANSIGISDWSCYEEKEACFETREHRFPTWFRDKGQLSALSNIPRYIRAQFPEIQRSFLERFFFSPALADIGVYARTTCRNGDNRTFALKFENLISSMARTLSSTRRYRTIFLDSARFFHGTFTCAALSEFKRKRKVPRERLFRYYQPLGFRVKGTV